VQDAGVQPTDPAPVVGAERAPESADPKANIPVAVHGLRTTLAVDRENAKAGEELKLTVTFENVSGEKLRIFWPVERYLADQITLEVLGDGVQTGMQLRDMMAFMPGLANFPELAPGEKRTLEIKITGNPPTAQRLAVHFTKPGVYNLRVIYAYEDATPSLGGLEDGGMPVPGKVWTGRVQTQTIEIKLSGEFNPLPSRGLLRRGGLMPQPRPMGQGMRVPEELMPDRNPQPAPARLEEK
jgi:hypothetical protein